MENDATTDDESELRRKKRDAGSDAAMTSDATVAPALPPAIEGWTLGEKVAARGQGTLTQNRPPTWKCKTYTTDRLPCGGWVSLELTRDGHARANVGVMGHDDFYTHVTGTSASNPNPPFPPDANNQFWNAFGSADLDGEGRGHIDLVRRNQWNQVSLRASVDVQVDHGTAVVSYASELDPGSCAHYEETCTLRVLAH